MLKRSPLKSKSILKSKSTLTKKSFLASKSSLNKSSLLKSTSTLQKNTELKKQNEVSKNKWEDVRDKALKRDNGKCIVCGKPATQVHHIHLRSERKDLVYELNNLCSLCSKHHLHKGRERYEEQTKLIALAKHMSVEELLKFAETKGE